MSQSVLLLSGGIDSGVCAALMKNIQKDYKACFIDYGQAALFEEAKAAKRIARHFNIDFETLKFKGPRKFSVGEIYGRNLFLISAALLHFGSKIKEIIFGIHAGVPYYDCSKEFLIECNKIVTKSSGGNVVISAPLISWTKREIIQFAKDYNFPIEITYSCEAGTVPPCGKCLSCKDRKGLNVR